MEYTEKEINIIFQFHPELKKAWAEKCGITIDDDRCICGWPEKFSYFYEGWLVAMKFYYVDQYKNEGIK